MAPRNERRQVLKICRDIKRWASDMVSTWDQSQTIHTGHGVRKLEDFEKRENDPARWAELALWMDRVHMQAKILADHARAMEEITRRHRSS